MPNRVQGEGDYESARRYNRHVADSIKKGQPKSEPLSNAGAKALERAEQAGKSRAKQGAHDATDAKLMKKYVEDEVDDE